MSIDFQSYDGLKGSVAAYLQRNNLSQQIPVWIALAEVRMRGLIHTMSAQMGTPWIIQPALGSNVVSLPTDLSAIAKVKYGTHYLDYISPENISSHPQQHGRNEYSTLGSNMYLETYVDGQKMLYIEYFRSIPSLSENNPSNWVLEDYPDIYLYATLIEAYIALRDDEGLPVVTQALQSAVQQMTDTDEAARYPSRSKLVMKAR